MEIEFRYVVFSVLDDLLVGDAFVRFRLVLECGQGSGKSLGVGFTDHLGNIFINVGIYIYVPQIYF